MPELPEVETVRQNLQQHVTGRKVISLEIMGSRTVRRHDPQGIKDTLTGKTIANCGRHGKYLILSVGKTMNMVIHLRMTGRLQLVKRPFTGDEKHLHARFSLDDGNDLIFFDPRTFGEIFVSKNLDVNNLPEEISFLGPDPILTGITAAYLQEALQGRSSPIKTLLLDQSIISGIGNIYGDEICHAAYILPTRPARSLKEEEFKLLCKSIDDVLTDAIAKNGSTLGDKKYLDLMGNEGHYQKYHRVYNRLGKSCFRCQTNVVKTKIGGRTSYYCTKCQI